MVDAYLRLKSIETTDIKNLIIGGQAGINYIQFCLAVITNGENPTILLSPGSGDTRTRMSR